MKILIVNNNMHIGGIQKALLNLLNEIGDLYDVTLLLFYPVGELIEDIPPNIKVIYGNCFTKILGMSQAEAKADGVLTVLWRTLFVVITKLLGTKISFGILSRMQKLDDVYDAAISYMQNGYFKMFYGGSNEFVINSVKAKRKISFVHCDFKNYEGNNKYNRDFYKHFDTVACVSESVGNRFLSATGLDKNKVQCVYNCCNYEEIKSLADEYVGEYKDGCINIFTAARLSEEKGFFRMLDIFKSIKDTGLNFIWRIAGDGPQRDIIKNKIEELGLEKEIIMLGILKNPYPYFKSSDLLLVPSYNEAAPMVFDEAWALGIPILTTDTTSAKELVLDRDIGVVCKNNDDAIKSALIDILKNKLERNDIQLFSNKRAVKQFNDIVGEKS